MADKNFDQLPGASPLNGTEIVPIAQSGATVGTTPQAIAALAPVQDHNSLLNLAAGDSHPQYLNQARGDLRYPLLTRVLTAGDGLVGGGDLGADRTFTVNPRANWGLSVAPTGLQFDLAGLGDLPEAVDASNDRLVIYNVSESGGRPRLVSPATALAGASGFVPTARLIDSGAGLTGGGDLSVDRTLAVGQGIGITVNADDVALDTTHARNVDHSAVSITTGLGLTGGGTIAASRTVSLDTANSRNIDHSAVSILPGTGLSGGGDISASRTLNVDATIVPLLAQSNIFTGQRQTLSHAAPTWVFEDTSEVVDEKKMLFILNTKVFSIRFYNDALTVSKDIFTATRGAAQAVTAIAIGNSTDNPTVTVNGVNVRSASLINTGTFANAQISLSSVTQHQGNFSIAWGQLTGTKNADQLLGLTPQQANVNSSIGQRLSDGGFRATYFEGVEVANEGTTISQFYINNGSDGRHRQASIAQVQSALGVGSAAFSGATVYKSGTQTINNNTITTISFDSEEVDEGTWHSTVTNNSRLTVPAGVSRARFVGIVTLDLPDATAYTDIYVALYRNGAIYKQVWNTPTSGEGTNLCTLVIDSGPVPVTPTWYYELVVYANAVSGTPTFNVQSLNFRTQFCVEKLS